MMKTETKRKAIHYKRAVLTNTPATLQRLFEMALKKDGKATRAKARREIINPDDQSFRLVNHHKEYGGMFFGQLIFFESGKSQAFITLDDDAEFYSIDSITPERITKEEDIDEKVKKRREFVDSMLYFGILDNHMVVMQSTALRSRDLETHLSWLLGTCTDLLGKDNALILQDKPTEAAIKKIQESPVKSIKLGAPVSARAEVDPVHAGEEVEKTSHINWIPCGMGVEVIRAILGQDWLNKLNLDDSLDDANLQVGLKITYLRKTTRNGQRMLDNIATSLRHMEEVDIRLDLQGGGTLRGDDLKLSGPISVKMINGMVDENDLYHQMHAWLVTKVREREIEVDTVSKEDKEEST